MVVQDKTKEFYRSHACSFQNLLHLINLIIYLVFRVTLQMIISYDTAHPSLPNAARLSLSFLEFLLTINRK